MWPDGFFVKYLLDFMKFIILLLISPPITVFRGPISAIREKSDQDPVPHRIKKPDMDFTLCDADPQQLQLFPTRLPTELHGTDPCRRDTWSSPTSQLTFDSPLHSPSLSWAPGRRGTWSPPPPVSGTSWSATHQHNYYNTRDLISVNWSRWTEKYI